MADILDTIQPIPVEESKGQLDPEQEYEFTLTDYDLKRGVKVSEKKTADYLELHWTENVTGITLKQSFNVSQKAKINPDKPEFESGLVKLSRQLGTDVKEGDQIVLNKILKRGMHIFAHVQEQIGKDKKPTGFHEINLNTIRPAKGKKTQTRFDVAADAQAEIMQIIKGSNKSEDAFIALVRAGKPGLTGDLEAMINAGKVTFPVK